MRIKTQCVRVRVWNVNKDMAHACSFIGEMAKPSYTQDPLNIWGGRRNSSRVVSALNLSALPYIHRYEVIRLSYFIPGKRCGVWQSSSLIYRIKHKVGYSISPSPHPSAKPCNPPSHRNRNYDTVYTQKGMVFSQFAWNIVKRAMGIYANVPPLPAALYLRIRTYISTWQLWIVYFSWLHGEGV